MSVKRTAPCGHPGEVVIGAYTRCLQGCSKDPHVQPVQALTNRRGEAGHVDYCACKPCTVRRRARVVVFRTKEGTVGATVAWDGVSKRVTWTSEASGTLRHWKLLDEDGDVMVDGMCDVHTSKGDPMHMDIDTIVPMKLAVHNRIWRFDPELRAKIDKAETRALQATFDTETYAVEVPPRHLMSMNLAYSYDNKSLRQAAKTMNFGDDNHWRGRYKIVAQVHDEVVVEYVKDDAKYARVEVLNAEFAYRSIRESAKLLDLRAQVVARYAASFAGTPGVKGSK